MRSNPKFPLSTTRRVRLSGWGVLRTLAHSLVAPLSPSSLPLSLSPCPPSPPPEELGASAWSRTVVVDISTAKEKEEN